MFSDSEWGSLSVISVSTNEVLKQKLRISEISSIILEALSVASDESLLQVSRPPNPLSHGWASEEMFSLLDEFVTSHLNVLIKQVASKNLLSVFVVELLRMDESVS